MQEDDSIDLNALDVNGFLDAQASQDSIHFNTKLGDDEDYEWIKESCSSQNAQMTKTWNIKQMITYVR